MIDLDELYHQHQHRMEDFWSRRGNTPQYETTIHVFGQPVLFDSNHERVLEAATLAEQMYSPWNTEGNGQWRVHLTVHDPDPSTRPVEQSGQRPSPAPPPERLIDHVHYAGNKGPHAGNARSGAVGGGHAHAGLMVYQGDNWPEQYRGKFFMNNIHGYRVNTDHIRREGSGYTASHGEDFLLTHDSWSQWLNYRIGPDGSVTAIDWYDKNQCHSPNPDVHEKTLGRIFNITHEQDEWVKVNLAEKSSLELVDLQLHENDWYVRHGRRILQERGPDEQVHQALRDILDDHPETPRKLRALWALHVTDGLDESGLAELLDHEDEYIRGWAIQLLMDTVNPPGVGQVPPDRLLHLFADMTRKDDSALVRLHLASALQKIVPERRWEILEGLYSRSEDANDHNLPLMIWYAAEPMVELDPQRILEMALETELPDILQFTVQRTGEAARGPEGAPPTASGRSLSPWTLGTANRSAVPYRTAPVAELVGFPGLA